MLDDSRLDFVRRHFQLLALSAFILMTSSCRPTKTITNQPTENTKQNYLQQRSNLIKADQSLNFSNSIQLNGEELRLDSILHQVRAEKLKIYKETHFFPPARNFYQSKEHIENDNIFHIIQQMPKGGALHVHTMAMGKADWVIDKAIETPNMYIYWGDELSGQHIKGQFMAYRQTEKPSGYRSVNELVQEDPDNKEIIKSLLTFDEKVNQDSFDIWNDFEKIFQRMTGFMRYEPIFPAYLKHGFEILINDNVQHVELRMPFRNNIYNLTDDALDQSIKPFVDYLNESLVYAQTLNPNFTARIIHANLRFKNNNTIWADMQQALEHKTIAPDWLAGYDLVAEEDNGHPTLFHLESFLKLDSLEKIRNIELPLYLHDGESNWTDNHNLYDAVLLNSRRIGHGFNLYRFPSLIKAVKKNNICIEINPLSNQILGYIRDLRMHPAQSYLTQGIDCTISSDDPQIFDYEGLSYDYWTIYMAWELGLADLKKLSQNGISYAALNPLEKKKALMHWEESWNLFITETLKDFN